MTDQTDQARLIANALYEIRILLSGYLGSENPGDPAARQAASLAYSLHNQALAVMSGESFDVAESISRLSFVDSQFGSNYKTRFAEALLGKP